MTVHFWRRTHCPKSFGIYSEIPSSRAASCSLEVRHPLLGYQLWTQRCRCCFRRAMSSNNNTYMLISGLSSQPGAPGRRPAAPSIGSVWMRQRVLGRRWGGKVGRRKEGVVSNTMKPPGLWCKWDGGCKKTKQHAGKDGHKGGKGRNLPPLKQCFCCGNHSRSGCQSRGLC